MTTNKTPSKHSSHSDDDKHSATEEHSSSANTKSNDSDDTSEAHKKEASMAINTTSSLNTPQANDDLYATSEDFLVNGGVLSMDVMSNDLGGKAKTLWSIDDGNGNPMDPANLLTSDVGKNWETTANGNQIRIVNGRVEFKAGNPAEINALAQGEVFQDSFTYAIRLANGTLSLATVRVNITGNNDAASISGTSTGGVTEDATLSTGGTLTVTDVDHGEAHFQAVAPEALAGTYGSFTFNSTTGQWNYALNNGTDGQPGPVQALKGGEVVYDTLTVTSADGTATQQINVAITGTNDAATISGTTTGDVTEDATLTANGTLTVSDVDHGEAHFQAVAPEALVGTYGSFTFDSATGQWNYTLNNGTDGQPGPVQSLKGGEVVYDTLTVTSADGTATQQIKVAITGTNDAATISGTTTGDVTEDATLTASGTLTVSDVDHGEAHFQAVAPEALAGTYGSFTFDSATGQWNYTLNNGINGQSGAVQSLKGGEVVYDTLTVTSTDGTATQDIKVAITGTNDAATISGTTTGGVTEDATLTASGTLAVADADNGEAHFQTVTDAALTGTYGSFAFDATNGQWTYTLNNQAGAVQALNSGDVVYDTLTVTSADGSATQDIKVAINGANEAPVQQQPTVPAVTVATPSTDGTDPNNHDDAIAPTILPSGYTRDINSSNNIISGSNGNDSINAQGGNDIVYGGSGDDNLSGQNGNDVIYGQAGNDNIDGGNDNDTLYGGSGNDDIFGNNGNDIIFGGSGNDTIDGGGGNDLIIGGYGADKLAGGQGADTFTYLDIRDTGDVITDFTVSQGDKLDFSAITGITNSTAANSNTVSAHSVNYFANGSDTVVWADTDGNTSTVEIAITLTGVAPADLGATNFVL